MKGTFVIVSLWIASVAVAAEPQTRPESSGYRFVTEAGPYEVGVLTAEWLDDARHRVIPVKVYYPRTVTGPLPVIIFSHGLGGSREGYAYLGRHWASHGYVCVHLQHKGSDEAVERGKTEEEARTASREAASAENAAARALDVSFAVAHLPEVNKAAGPLQRRLDPERVGVAGHSFGAHTTLCAAGARSRLRPEPSAQVRNPCIRAAIAMSPPPPTRYEDTYEAVDIPCLHMTGTKDDAPMFGIEARHRRMAFDQIRAGDQFLVTFQGGDHRVFSASQPHRGSEERDRRFQSLIRGCTLAFWDTYLSDDAKARRWLVQDMRATVAPDAAVESKSRPTSRQSQH